MDLDVTKLGETHKDPTHAVDVKVSELTTTVSAKTLVSSVKAAILAATDNTLQIRNTSYAMLMSAVTELGDFITAIFKTDTQGVSDHTDIDFRKALNEIVTAIEYF